MKKLSLLISLLLFSCLVYAQQERHYWIEFTDKNDSPYSIDNPEDFLSKESIERREKQGLRIAETDLPVNEIYLDSLRGTGVEIVFTSRWLNAATVKTADSTLISKIYTYAFVKDTIKLKKKGDGTKLFNTSQANAIEPFTKSEYGKTYEQIALHSGEVLHNRGYRGQGMTVALLDAGYLNVHVLAAFEKMRNEGRLMGTYDFVDHDEWVYDAHTHGLLVLSTMAGYIPGEYIGTAPEASYYLFRTENSTSETPLEEAAWIAGMERADSLGVWVVNSSLGYSTFDSGYTDHLTYQLTGRDIIVSRAASMAASKGIVLVNSAGNEGSSKWFHITAPADAENILTVGAITNTGELAPFSSRGPTADGRVKPDVVAIGVSTQAIDEYGNIINANGTSLSSPVIAGLVTCLWQEFPNKSSYDVIDAVIRSSDNYRSPDDETGYGIPDFALAREILKGNYGGKAYLGEVYPNPFSSTINVSFFSPSSSDVSISLVDMLGRIVYTTTSKADFENLRRIEITPPADIRKGVYVLTIQTEEEVLFAKLLKN